MFLRKIVGKHTIFFLCVGTFDFKQLGRWVDHILEQLWVLHNFNQTTQTVACWERAYPHCSLGKCQLVLRTSKQSLLPSPLLSPSSH